jgi:hypothetical protein
LAKVGCLALFRGAYLKTSVTRDAEIAAWTGTRDDLRLLLDQIKAAFRDAEHASLAAIENERLRLRGEGFDEAATDRLLRYSQNDHTRTWIEWVSASDRRNNAEHSGRLDEVLDALPLRDIDRLTLRFPFGGSSQARSVSVRFARSYGVRLTVEADEPVWATAMRASLLEELKRHKPWWSFLFRIWGATAFFIVSAATAFLIVNAALDQAGVRRDGVLVLWATTSFVTVAGLIFSATSILGALLPRFEIFAPGGTATGSKRATWVITVVVSALVGVAAQALLA